MDLGKTIASLRAQKGWTQLDLAKKLNVSDKTISKWENGGGYPEITQLPVLASIFNVSIDYLMTGKEPNVEIKVVSKIEDIIMNDDVDEFIKISDDLLTVKDIDGLFAFEYLYKYYSPKIALEYEKRKLDFRKANLGEKERNVSSIICWLYGINIGDSVTALPNFLINEILSKYEIMPLEIKIRVLKHVHYSFIEYVINKSKYKDEIVELFIEHNPTIKEKETFSFLVENNFLNIILKYYKVSDFNIDLVCKYKDYFLYEDLVPLCVDNEGRANIKTLTLFGDYNLSKVVFQKYDVTLLEDIFIDDDHGVEYVYILNARVPNTGFLTMQNNPTIHSTVHYIDNFGNRTFTNYARQVIVNKYSNDKEDIKNQINKYYKNGFLANQFIRQYRNRLNRKLKMCYISDLYNRRLYEDCIELMGKKLEEYFSIVCGLNGSLEEMANEYFNKFEPNIIEKGIVYDSTLNLDGVYQEERGMINRSISTLINHIIYLYNKVLNNEYHEGRDKVFESELNLLGNIYDETVIHLSNISDD